MIIPNQAWSVFMVVIISCINEIYVIIENNIVFLKKKETISATELCAKNMTQISHLTLKILFIFNQHGHIVNIFCQLVSTTASRGSC